MRFNATKFSTYDLGIQRLFDNSRQQNMFKMKIIVWIFVMSQA